MRAAPQEPEDAVPPGDMLAAVQAEGRPLAMTTKRDPLTGVVKKKGKVIDRTGMLCLTHGKPTDEYGLCYGVNEDKPAGDCRTDDRKRRF
jgi:hypothetical protein